MKLSVEEGVPPPRSNMGAGSFLHRALWQAGQPGRWMVIVAIRGYRASLGKLAGGRCRFHPSCSAYAEQVVAEWGVVRGGALAAWRVLRCSPLTVGGVDHPPHRSRRIAAHSLSDGRAA